MGANYQLGVAEKLVMKESPHKASISHSDCLESTPGAWSCWRGSSPAQGWRPEKLGNLAEISSFSARS